MMTPRYSYLPSQLLPENEVLREQNFTRWIPLPWLQLSFDFLKNIGLLMIYSECSPEDHIRSIQWHPPEGCGSEIRSRLAREQFEQVDQRNVDRGWPLLTLSINTAGTHSAVWIEPENYQAGFKFLAALGIAPARRIPL